MWSLHRACVMICLVTAMLQQEELADAVDATSDLFQPNEAEALTDAFASIWRLLDCALECHEVLQFSAAAAAPSSGHPAAAVSAFAGKVVGLLVSVMAWCAHQASPVVMEGLLTASVPALRRLANVFAFASLQSTQSVPSFLVAEHLSVADALSLMAVAVATAGLVDPSRVDCVEEQRDGWSDTPPPEQPGTTLLTVEGAQDLVASTASWLGFSAATETANRHAAVVPPQGQWRVASRTAQRAAQVSWLHLAGSIVGALDLLNNPHVLPPPECVASAAHSASHDFAVWVADLGTPVSTALALLKAPPIDDDAGEPWLGGRGSPPVDLSSLAFRATYLDCGAATEREVEVARLVGFLAAILCHASAHMLREAQRVTSVEGVAALAMATAREAKSPELQRVCRGFAAMAAKERNKWTNTTTAAGGSSTAARSRLRHDEGETK